MFRLATFIIGVLCATAVFAQSNLSVEVSMSKPTGGTLRLVLCPNADGFATERGCVLQQVRVTGPAMTITFADIPVGDHAIKAFHDVNDNGKLDTNWMGIPTEPYGFSNNAMGTFGPPSFQQASFGVKPGSNTVRFRMKG